MDNDEVLPLKSYSLPHRRTTPVTQPQAPTYSVEYEAVARAGTSDVSKPAILSPLTVARTNLVNDADQKVQQQRWADRVFGRREQSSYIILSAVVFLFHVCVLPFILSPGLILSPSSAFSARSLLYSIVATLVACVLSFICNYFTPVQSYHRSLKLVTRFLLAPRKLFQLFIVTPLCVLIFLYTSLANASLSTSSQSTQSFSYHYTNSLFSSDMLGSVLYRTVPIVEKDYQLFYRECLSLHLSDQSTTRISIVPQVNTYSTLPVSSLYNALAADTGLVTTLIGKQELIVPNPTLVYTNTSYEWSAFTPTHAPAVPLSPSILQNSISTDSLSLHENNLYRAIYIDSTAFVIVLFAVLLAVLLVALQVFLQHGLWTSVPAISAELHAFGVFIFYFGIILMLFCMANLPFTAVFLPFVARFVKTDASNVFSTVIRGATAIPPHASDHIITTNTICPVDYVLAYIPYTAHTSFSVLFALPIAGMVLFIILTLHRYILEFIHLIPIDFSYDQLLYTLESQHPMKRHAAQKWLKNIWNSKQPIVARLEQNNAVTDIVLKLQESDVLNSARSIYTWLHYQNMIIINLNKASNLVKVPGLATYVLSPLPDIHSLTSNIETIHPDSCKIVSLRNRPPVITTIALVTDILLSKVAYDKACVPQTLASLTQLMFAIQDYQVHIAHLYARISTDELEQYINKADRYSQGLGAAHQSVLDVKNMTESAIKLILQAHPTRLYDSSFPLDIAQYLQKMHQ